MIQNTDRAEKSAHLLGNILFNSYGLGRPGWRKKPTGISLFGTPGTRLMISDSKTDSLCKIHKKMLFTVDTGRLWTQRMLRFQLCQMETVGEDGATTDGRRKEIHCHLCRKEKHLFSEYSPHHVDVFMDTPVCINLETNTDTILRMKSPRKQKWGAVIFSFRKM